MIGWFGANLLWASAAMLLVLAVRRPVARLFGAGAAYALWLLPALRLVMPPWFAWGAEIPSLLPPLTLIVPVGDAAAPLPPDGGPGQWVPMLLAIWAGGAAAFIAWQWLAYRRFLVQLSLSSRSLGAHRGLPLIESKAVAGPLALGLLDRRIVVPVDFGTRYAPEERRLALDHESVHHRRGDIWWNHAALLVLAFYWFNPIAWLAFRAFRADQELACDAAVAGRAPPAERHSYARALIKSASRPGLIAACPLNHADQLKRRLKMMKDHRSSKLRMLGGAAAVALFGALSLSLGSPGLAQDERTEQKQERRERFVIVHTKEGETVDRSEVRRFRRSVDGSTERLEGCEGDGEIANVEDGSGDRRTRIVLCGRAGASPAERVEMLERAKRRIADNERLSAEERQRIAGTIDREIERARGN